MNRAQRRRKPLPGYRHRLLAAASDLAALRGVSICEVQHDGTCAIFQRHPCNCTPDISVTNNGGVLLIDGQGVVSRTRKQ